MGRCNSSVIVLHFTLLLHYYYTTFEKTKKHGGLLVHKRDRFTDGLVTQFLYF